MTEYLRVQDLWKPLRLAEGEITIVLDPIEKKYFAHSRGIFFVTETLNIKELYEMLREVFDSNEKQSE